jgi:hypothetical protein
VLSLFKTCAFRYQISQNMCFDITFCTGSGRRTHSLQIAKNLYGAVASPVDWPPSAVQQIATNVSSSGIYFYIYGANYGSVFVPHVIVLVQKLNHNSHPKCKSKSPKTTRFQKSAVSFILLLRVRVGGYIVNLLDFYSYRFIGKLTAFSQLQELELEDLKIKTRLTNEKFSSVKGECEI